MPGGSSRVCSWAFGALIKACKRGTVPDVFISLNECSSLVSRRNSRSPGILERNWCSDFAYSAEIRSRTLGLGGITPARGIRRSNFPALSSDTSVEVINGCVDRGTSYSLTGGTFSLSRNFASSASYSVSRQVQKAGSKLALKRKDKKRFNPHGENGRGLLLRSKDPKGTVRGSRFSWARSSVKDVQSGITGGISHARNARLKTTQGSARKRVSPTVRSARKLGQSIGTKEGGKRGLWRKLKAEERPHDEGERIIKRRRKRIRPQPRDITFKRGLDSDAQDIGLPVPVPEQKAVEDKPLSVNAKLRQTEPSRELLRQIEENLLGRRRLVEWRRAGFDPTRTAPLDDVPNSKDRRAPIQETSINFFSLGSDLCLVDLPGYGFAFAKAHVKEDWEELVKEYVTSRSNLKRVCLLVDAKWGLKPRDHELLQLMESSRTRYQIILTKTDVLPPLDLARRATQILQILKDHQCLVQPLMMASSKTGAGLPHLRASLARVVSGHSRVLQQGTI